MTVTVTVLVPAQTINNTQTTMYTATGVTAIIDKFTATNYSAAAATISVNGKKPEPSMDIRQGLVTRANGVKALIVWIEHTSTAILQIGIE